MTEIIPNLSDLAAGGRASRMLSRKTTETDYWYTIGYVVTPHGVVGVYMQADHTSLSVVRGGRHLTGRWPHSYTEQSLVTLCKRFAEVPAVDWVYPAVISHDGREAFIVAIRAKHPGSGAFRRLVDNITAAGLTPVVVCPLGATMPAILKRWRWCCTIQGPDGDKVEEWRPPAKELRRRCGAQESQ